MNNNNINITNSLSYLNVSAGVNLANYGNWLKRNEDCGQNSSVLMLNDSNTNTNENNQSDKKVKSKDELLKNFYAIFKSATDIAGKELKGTIHPLEYNLDLFDLIINIVNNFCNQYTLKRPEDKEFVNDYELFKEDLAYLRYDAESQIIDKTLSFLTKIQEKYEKNRIEITNFENEIQRLKKIEKILKICPDLLDFYLRDICQFSTTSDNINYTALTNIVLLQENYKIHAKQLHENIQWFIQIAQQKLNGFDDNNVRDIYHKRTVSSFIEGINKLKFTILPQLSQFVVGRVDRISSLKSRITILEKQIDYLATPHDGENIINGVVPPFSESAGDIKLILKTIGQIDGFLTAPDDELYPFLTKSYYCKDISAGYYTKREVNQFKDFLLVNQKIHILFDTYVCRVTMHLKSKLDLCHIWVEQYKGTLFWKKSIVELSKPFAIQAPSLLAQNNKGNNSEPLPEWVLKTNKPSSGQKVSIQKSKPKPKAGKGAAASSKNSKVKKKENSCEKELSIQDSPITWLKMAKYKLEGIVGGQFLTLEKESYSSLRQVILALENVILLHEHNHYSQFQLINAIRDCYYVCEQILRYHVLTLTSNKRDYDHDLNFKIRQIEHAENVNEAAVEVFQNGHLWPHSGYVTHSLWKRLQEQKGNVEIPKYLLWFMDASEGLNTKSEKIGERVVDVLTTTVNLLASLKIFKKLESSIENKKEDKRDVECIEHNLKLKENLTQNIHDKLSQFLEQSQLSSDFEGILKIKQSKLALGQFDQAREILRKRKMSSSEFCHALRNAIYWQHNFYESLFQGIIALRHGWLTHNHDLESLLRDHFEGIDECVERVQSNADVKSVKCNGGVDGGEGVLKFFSENYNSIYSDCRYPFDVPEVRSPFHRIILRGEILRGSSISAVSFIDFRVKDVSPSMLISECEEITGQAINYVELILGKYLP